MPLQIGIVGLPNVGKSTLFNALTRSRKANVANYPFCTIDPNVGVVELPDERLARLAEMVKPERVVPATVEFVDIAGLVKGASKGEGLGNKFLANIRECHAIAQVVRAFIDPNVIHVHGDISPKRDIEIIHAELILADLETLERRLNEAKSKAKSGDPKVAKYAQIFSDLKAHFDRGGIAYDFADTKEKKEAIADLHLLTDKPFLYIANVSESEIKTFDPALFAAECGLKPTAEIIPISAKIEEELAQMKDEDSKIFLEDLGLREPGLFALIHAAYRTLGYLTFFTAGPKEARAWTTFCGATAPQAAGVIHTDFEKGFIAAEIISYEDYVACGGEAGAKGVGKMRVEGKEYIMKDGDVAHFRFNV
ncbi:redox-regulated ATPase YchF [Candidatus Peregrinibacteria bacterium]|nr:redox-regulated ATPase YchF [Candidatus Peregrinibacteria bacterium]